MYAFSGEEGQRFVTNFCKNNSDLYGFALRRGREGVNYLETFLLELQQKKIGYLEMR
jgi:hypothetical protein